MNILPCGDRAVLLDCASLDEARSWFAALDGRVDVVLGAQSVVAHGRPADLRSIIDATDPPPVDMAASGEPITIAVDYDGPDLSNVAEITGLSIEGIITAHTGTSWSVAFGGFAPGFFYLTGGDSRLEVPRRETPRTRVPRGSVGLAGPFSGIYPRESPGGWHLIGRTEASMWDTGRTPPSLLTAGHSVQFVIA